MTFTARCLAKRQMCGDAWRSVSICAWRSSVVADGFRNVRRDRQAVIDYFVADLEIGSTQGFEASACVLLPPGETVTVRMLRSTVRKCTVGVNVLSGTAIVERGTITFNGAGIQHSNGGTVTGATVTADNRASVELINCGFRVVNNFIVKNGAPNSLFGGVRLRDYLALPALHDMSFNTIADNQANNVLASGITCSSITAALALSSNLIVNNSVTPTSGATNCSYTYSAFSPTLTPGTGNLLAAPTFVDALNSNFHLKDAGTNVGIANPTTGNDPAATLATDVDGEVRPQGGGTRDLGADEVP